MKEGLLWFDNDPNRALGDKIKRAAARYQARLQHKPTICYLSAKEFKAEIQEVNGIQLKPAHNIQPHYFWLGTEHQTAEKKAA